MSKRNQAACQFSIFLFCSAAGYLGKEALNIGLSAIAVVTLSCIALCELWDFRRDVKLWLTSLRLAAEVDDVFVAQTVFDGLELFLPRRMCKEDLGDALEVIGRLVEQRKMRWRVYVKILTTSLWVAFNGLREIASILGRRRSNG
jgi:hypothetical protein